MHQHEWHQRKHHTCTVHRSNRCTVRHTCTVHRSTIHRCTDRHTCNLLTCRNASDFFLACAALIREGGQKVWNLKHKCKGTYCTPGFLVASAHLSQFQEINGRHAHVVLGYRTSRPKFMAERLFVSGVRLRCKKQYGFWRMQEKNNKMWNLCCDGAVRQLLDRKQTKR